MMTAIEPMVRFTSTTISHRPLEDGDRRHHTAGGARLLTKDSVRRRWRLRVSARQRGRETQDEPEEKHDDPKISPDHDVAFFQARIFDSAVWSPGGCS